jgi:hypothetical protein
LNKCWLGYEIAKSELDTEDMIYYANGIRKFQREFKIPVSDFPQLGLTGELTNDEERDSDTEFCTANEDDIEQDPFGYESEAQRMWRERMEKGY